MSNSRESGDFWVVSIVIEPNSPGDLLTKSKSEN